MNGAKKKMRRFLTNTFLMGNPFPSIARPLHAVVKRVAKDARSHLPSCASWTASNSAIS